MEDKNGEAKKGGTIPESAVRQKVMPFTQEIIDRLVSLMRSDNDNAALGAARTLLAKILPDLKMTEIHGGFNDDGTTKPVNYQFLFGNEYDPLSRTFAITTSSDGHIIQSSPTIQDSNLASSGTQNNNSHLSDSQTGTS